MVRLHQREHRPADPLGADAMIADNGDAWLGMLDGGITRYTGKRWTSHNPFDWGTAPWPFDVASASASVQAEDGSIWVATDGDGVGRWDGESWTTHLDGQSISAIEVAPNGDVWVAPEQWAVQRWDGESWHDMGSPWADAELRDIVADDQGRIWLASGHGHYRWQSGAWKRFSPDDSGLPSLDVWSVALEPGGGAIWVGTTDGVARFDGSSWDVHTEADGLPADRVSTIDIGVGGDVWVGAFDGTWPYHGGVARYDGASRKAYTAESSDLPHERVESVAVDGKGRVWIMTAIEGGAILRP